jgi:hypothetical protein
MSAERIIREIEALDRYEREKVLQHIREKYLNQNAAVLGSNYNWWNNEEDDIYNEQ